MDMLIYLDKTMLTEPPPTRSLKFETDRRGLRSNIWFVLFVFVESVICEILVGWFHIRTDSTTATALRAFASIVRSAASANRQITVYIA